MFMMNIPFILKAVWGLVKRILDPQTQRKIQMVDPGSKELFACINKSQVEQKFGGTAPNVTDYYFPHTVPSEEYFVQGDDEKKLQLDEEEYRIKVESDERIVKSPYYVPTPAAQLIFENVQQKEEIKSDSNVEERVARRNFSVTSNDVGRNLFTELDDKENEICQPIESEYSIEANDKNHIFFGLKTSFVKPKVSFNVPKSAYTGLLLNTHSNCSPTNSTKAANEKNGKENKRIISAFPKNTKLPFGINMKIKAEV